MYFVRDSEYNNLYLAFKYIFSLINPTSFRIVIYKFLPINEY
jgi:hypothetical protein